MIIKRERAIKQNMIAFGSRFTSTNSFTKEGSSNSNYYNNFDRHYGHKKCQINEQIYSSKHLKNI